MTDRAPKISVIMPVWNGEAHLREAVDSILNQTEGNFEFLIIDDGSTDGTVSLIESYDDPRIRLIRQEHEGIVVALNRGVSEARAEWIARMDADDIARPERFEKQIAALADVPDAVLCHTQIAIFGEEQFIKPLGRFIKRTPLTLLRLCYQNTIVHPTVMFKKTAFLACGGYLAEERHAEDFGLWGRLVSEGSIVGVDIPLLNFRVHQGSISKQKAEVQMRRSRKIALRHCRLFMELDEDQAERALTALRYQSGSSRMNDWWWLVFHCMPRLRKQDLALWLWACKRTLDRIHYALRR